MYRKLLLILLLTLVIEFRLFVLSTSPTTSVSISYDGEYGSTSIANNDQLKLDLSANQGPLETVNT